MARIRPIVLILSTAALAAADPARGDATAASRRPAESRLILPATIDHVIDGDSIAVRLDSGPMEVRLHGADAPEWDQPFGRQAKDATRRRLKEGQAVELLPVEQDRYDRMVAVIYAKDASVNETLVADGFAWAYRDYLGQVEGDANYCEAEAAARSAHRGLWSQPPELWVPPWVYRERQRAAPGAKLPSRDYSRETAGDCVAAISKSGPAPFPQGPDRPLGQSSSTPDCRIKGNINGKGAKIYHVPGGRDYDKTRISPARGERWFCTEAQAQQAGWQAAR